MIITWCQRLAMKKKNAHIFVDQNHTPIILE